MWQHGVDETTGAGTGMKVALNVVVETNDNARVLATGFREFTLNSEDARMLIAFLQDVIDRGKSAEDDHKELDVKARFDPSIL